MNPTAHDVILHAPITGTPSPLPAIVAAGGSNGEGVSEVEKELYFFMRENLLFSK